jgi:uncharacterized protein YifN (PemK superfamily)
LSKRKNNWFCDFKKWEEAQIRTTKYDSRVILEKVKHSLLSVKRDLATESDLIISPLLPNQKFNLNLCVMSDNTFVRLLGLSLLPLKKWNPTSGWLILLLMA